MHIVKVHGLEKSGTNYLCELLCHNTDREPAVKLWWRKHGEIDFEEIYAKWADVLSIWKPIDMWYYSYKNYKRKKWVRVDTEKFVTNAIQRYEGMRDYIKEVSSKEPVYIVLWEDIIRNNQIIIQNGERKIINTIDIQKDVDKRIIDGWAKTNRKKQAKFYKDFYLQRKYIQYLTEQEFNLLQRSKCSLKH